MADQAIAMNSGATIDGRLLARIAVVTMDSDTIVKTIAMSGGATPARGRHRAGRAA